MLCQVTALHCVAEQPDTLEGLLPPENVTLTVGDHDLQAFNETGIQQKVNIALTLISMRHFRSFKASRLVRNDLVDMALIKTDGSIDIR